MKEPTVEDVLEGLGHGPFVSAWLEVTQALMDRFGEATRDADWMHLDPKRAAREGPFGGTVAFGFWTLSLLTHFLRDCTGREYPPGARYGLNYGLDRVRFLAPVPVGARIRDHLSIVAVTRKAPGRFLVRTHHEIEIEGRDGRAMVADWLVLFVYPTEEEGP